MMLASFSGPELSNHSAWSSLENGDRSEAKPLICLSGRRTQTKGHDVHTSPFGFTSDLVDNNSATHQDATQHVANSCNEQIGIMEAVANVSVHTRLANLGINNQSNLDLAPPQMEGNNGNHGPCPRLAELSFRIDSPSDLGGEFSNVYASSNALLAKGIESQLYCGASYCSGEGQVGMLVAPCKSETSLKRNVHAMNPTSFALTEERMGEIFNGEGAVSSSLLEYTQNCNNIIGREARLLDNANAECIDEEQMKIEGVQGMKARLSGQSNEPKIGSPLNRECQSRIPSSRSNYESVKASHKEKYLERSITYPRASQGQSAMQAQPHIQEEVVDYEDLYLPEVILLNQRHNYKSPFNLSSDQKVFHSEVEENYPVLMNDNGSSFPPRQGVEGSSFAIQDDVNSDGADLNKATTENFDYRVAISQLSSAKANPSQIDQNGSGGNFIDQFDCLPFCLAGPHEHTYGRFQNSTCHCSDEYCVDLYCSQLPSSSHACALPMASHQFAARQFSLPKDINPTSCTNSCYNQHACNQQPSHTYSSRRPHLGAPTYMQHLPMSYQPLHTRDQYLQHTAYGRCSRNLSQIGLHKQQWHVGAGFGLQPESPACCARKENGPPLPGPGAAPYVLCQGCDKILQVPANLHNKNAVQKIRCGTCRKTSKFCNPLHGVLLKDGLATGSRPATHGSPFLNKHRAYSTSAKVGMLERNFLHNAVKTPVPVKLDRTLKSSCGLGGQHNKQIIIQGPCENELRYDTTYRLPDSSGTVREDYTSSLPFIVNRSGVLRNAAGNSSLKMQQFKSRVDTKPQHSELGQGKEALGAPRHEDSVVQWWSDSRVRVSSGELQGLTSKFLEEGSCDGSPLMEHIANHSLQQGQGHVGILNNGLHEASHSPAPGSPLFELLSHDAASESGEWALKQEEKGKEANVEPSLQEGSKGAKFLSGLLKFGRGQGSNKNWKVVINGRILSHAAVKSAEKQAGTIRPGTYWYDYQAGFWGVMGGPCLGIIPPSIAEFRVPLNRECAGGTTGVFVNGRELHKKDLDALASRGLPRTPGKAYMVDIGGQVVDQASGQLLRSLGRLAPTIERKGRGCGMFQPPMQS